MKQAAFTQVEFDLHQLQSDEQELRLREETLVASRKQMALERVDLQNTLPPSDMVAARTKQKEHETFVSRSEVRNVRLEQGRSLLLLVLLVATAASLVWWGIQLIQG